MASTRIAFCLSLAALLAACGGDTAPPTETGSLTGTWYFKSSSGGATRYVGEHTILEQGENVLITYCDRTSVVLVRRGMTLREPNGSTYYLSIRDSNTLVSAPRPPESASEA